MSSKHPNGPHYHEIVHLQAGLAVQFSSSSFQLPSPYTFDFTSYDSTSPSEVVPRISTATIVITNVCHISAETLSPEVTPNLQLIAVVAAGTDCVDLDAAEKRKIPVCNVPAASTISVAEHAVGLYFAVRRKLVELDNLVKAGVVWPKLGTLKDTFEGKYPRTCSLEVAGIVGYGSLGKTIEKHVTGLGMSTIIADRKPTSSEHAKPPPPGRMSFSEVIAKSSVIVICCPLAAETRNLISEPELNSMLPDAVIVNVSRGGIVNEAALAKALRERRIAGAATDVFLKEPSNKETSPLLEDGVPNLVATPHLAWYAESTVDRLKKTVVGNVEAFVGGHVQNAVVGLF